MQLNIMKVKFIKIKYICIYVCIFTYKYIFLFEAYNFHKNSTYVHTYFKTYKW